MSEERIEVYVMSQGVGPAEKDYAIYDDWETIDAIRELPPSNVEIFGSTD